MGTPESTPNCSPFASLVVEEDEEGGDVDATDSDGSDIVTTSRLVNEWSLAPLPEVDIVADDLPDSNEDEDGAEGLSRSNSVPSNLGSLGRKSPLKYFGRMLGKDKSCGQNMERQ